MVRPCCPSTEDLDSGHSGPGLLQPPIGGERGGLHMTVVLRVGDKGYRQFQAEPRFRPAGRISTAPQ